MSGPYDRRQDFSEPGLSEEARNNRRTAAYQAVFGSAIGRLVLRDILNVNGVGQLRGPPGQHPAWGEYAQGLHDAAVGMMEAAGFRQADLIESVMTDNEGYYDERTEDE